MNSYKTCSRCNQRKKANTVNFKPQKQLKSRLTAICRACKQIEDRIYSRKYRLLHPEWKKENNAKNKELVSECVRAWRKNNPEKYKTMLIYKKALRNKKIIKQPCVICGEEKVDGHHCDYSKPLDVI